MFRLTRILWKLRRLNENAELEREAILQLRERKFRKLLHHAWDATEFYPEYYSEHGIERDELATIPIEELPSIDKQTYIEHFDALTTDEELTRDAIDQFVETHDRDDRFRDEYIVVHTSGTTGDPTYFVYDRDAWETVLAGAIRAVQGEFGFPRLLAGLVTGYRVAYVAAIRGRFGGVMAVDRATSGLGFDSLLLDVNRPLAEWKEEFADFDPDVVVGYPSAIKLVCDFVAEDDLDLDIFRAITGGEPLSAEMRRYVERTLDTEVFDVYGASESIIIGLERGGFRGMFLFDDLNYVEPAQRMTYVTPLYNYSQPLIRYKLDDKLTTIERTGDEPLPFTMVESVVGRSEEIMWFQRADRTEEFLHPLVLDEIETEGLIRYQFVQRSDREFTVRLERQPSMELQRIESEVSAQLDDILEEKGLDDLEYSFVDVDEIPIDPETGKRKLVIKEI